MNNINSIGIIGFGKFSELMINIFKEHTPHIQIKVSSRSQSIDNQLFFSLEEVCNCDIIIPSVPISAFEETIIKIKDLVKPTAIIIDICSVKIHPKNVMLTHLNSSNNIICTHPNFGPESYRLNGNSTRNLNFIIENVRCEDKIFVVIIKFLEKLQVKIITMTAEEHDKIIGVPHFISMYIGQTLSQLGITRTEFGAASTQRMFDMIEGVGKDFQILKDMHTYNPFCKEVLGNIKSVIKEIL
jgi:prephenate dehydrogenase